MCMVGREGTIPRYPQPPAVRGVGPRQGKPARGEDGARAWQGLGLTSGIPSPLCVWVSSSVSGAPCAHPQGFGGRQNSIWARTWYTVGILPIRIVQ